MTENGPRSIKTPGGNKRLHVEDGDEVYFTAWAGKEGAIELAGRSVGFAQCKGVILPAIAD